eukprot:Lankesteria_metandrocarpae@DN4855_c0_g1_i1.p1
MAKSKNHTNHNQNKKAHKNGIKIIKRHSRVPSLTGMSQKFLAMRRTNVKRNNNLNRDRKRGVESARYDVMRKTFTVAHEKITKLTAARQSAMNAKRTKFADDRKAQLQKLTASGALKIAAVENAVAFE